MNTVEMKNLPEWIQELWKTNPSAARKAEKQFIALKVADVQLNATKESFDFVSIDELYENDLLPLTDEDIYDEHHRVIGQFVTFKDGNPLVTNATYKSFPVTYKFHFVKRKSTVNLEG